MAGTSDMAAASRAVRYQLACSCATRASSAAPKGRSKETQQASTAWWMLLEGRSLAAAGDAEEEAPASHGACQRILGIACCCGHGASSNLHLTAGLQAAF